MTKPGPPPTVSPRRRGRTVIIGLLVTLTLGALIAPSVLHALAGRAVEHRSLLAASQYVEWERRVLPRSSSAVLLHLRVLRKLGDVARFESLERDARAWGIDPTALERERWLLEAQAGVMSQGPERLTKLLNDPRDDGREICEAFVNGYVLNYQVDEALVLLEAWKGDYPADPMPWLVLGRIEEHRGDAEKSAVCFERALSVDPRYAPAAYNLARLKLTRTAVDEARRLYEQAAQSLELPAPAEVGLAHCDRLQNRLEAAAQRLRRVIGMPRDQLALAYRLVGDPQEAGESAPWMEFGQLQLAQNQPGDAVQTFRTVLARAPHNQAVRFQLANALRGSGQLTEAEAEYERVKLAKDELTQLTPILTRVRENPRDPQARAELGALFLKHLSEPQGLVWLRSALELDPGCRAAHQALAEYYERLAAERPDAARLATWHRAQLASPETAVPVPTP